MTIGSAVLYLILLFIQAESFKQEWIIITRLSSFFTYFFLTIHNFSKLHLSVFHDLHFYDRQSLALPLTWLHSLYKYVYLCRTLCSFINVYKLFNSNVLLLFYLFRSQRFERFSTLCYHFILLKTQQSYVIWKDNSKSKEVSRGIYSTYFFQLQERSLCFKLERFQEK